MAEQEREIAGVGISHPDKVLFPDQGVTKQDLAGYYVDIEKWIMPHLARRLISFVRCPSGSDQACFFQRHPGQSLPDPLEKLSVSLKSGESSEYVYLRDLSGLVATVQMGVLELHIWGSRIDDIDRPDRLVFDLDPALGLGFDKVKTAASDLHQLLADIGLESFVMTTGGKGFHVIVPIERRSSWDDARELTAGCAAVMARREPEHYTSNASKEKREGRIFIDYLRNSRSNTAICPYSVRRHNGAPIATPLSWDELGSIDSARDYKLDNIRARLGRLAEDPWKKMHGTRQRLSKKTLETLKDLD
ncbi:MAG: non-homologous end-joining DNA ligase [Wenzhouxiangellaceae bacterium]|nr:non-homologous end-joining DNA ligase [Wenzhouxiangellaceae bacterium]